MRDNNDDTILIVDDNPTNLQLLLTTLQNAGFKVLIATDGEQALQRAELGKPDLILLDVVMPGMDGYATCQGLKNNPQLQDIPVIFMTALAETEDKLAGFVAGGVDYVTKPFAHEEVLARVRTHLTLRKLQAAIQQQNQRLQDITTQLQAITDALSGFLRTEQLTLASQRLLQTAVEHSQSQHGMLVAITTDGEQEGYTELLVQALHGVLDEWGNRPLFDYIKQELKQQHRVEIDAESVAATDWLQVLLKQQQIVIRNSDAAVASDFLLGAAKQRHILAIPLHQGPHLIGFIVLANRTQGYSMEQATALERLQQAAAVLLSYARSRHREATAVRLQEQAEAEVDYLREEVKGLYNFDQIICHSESFREVLRQVEQVAATDSTVLIHGETGTGKELIAQAVHNLSARNKHPLIKVNCAALPSELVESELFGHEKGAFTGALAQRKGRFELADGGTLFLDEIGDMPLSAQSKLLRALQEREIERVGGHETITVDVRVLAASHHDLLALVGQGRFREDLFYRLNVFPIDLPPLRERREDIRPLVRFFADRAATKLGRSIRTIDETAAQRLLNYHWPGNVRELENLIERAVILSAGDVLQVVETMFPETVRQITVSSGQSGTGNQVAVTNATTDDNKANKAAQKSELPTDMSLEEMQRYYILKVLEGTQWIIEGEEGAAAILGLKPSTLRNRMQKLDIQKPMDISSDGGALN